MINVQRNDKGFTLIELLIVIAIIGILAAIAIPAYTGYTKKSKVSGAISAMGALKNAVVAYYTEAGGIPAVNTIATVGSTVGVTPPGQYISNVAIATSGNITATLTNIGSDVKGSTVTLNTTDLRSWTWGGTLSSQYMPKAQ